MVSPGDSKQSAEASLDRLTEVLTWLDSEPDSSDRWGRLDAVAKRFEVAFEYVWKALQAASEWEGTEAPGPRPAIQAAAQYGWLEDVEQWAEFVDARNRGVHDYFGLSSEEYATVARDFESAARQCIKSLPVPPDHS